MKKNFYLKAMALSVCLFLSVSNLSAYDFSGGSGTARDPYLITTLADFDNIRTARDQKFQLTNDLDFSGYVREDNQPWWPIGEWGAGDNDPQRFSGVFDGNGFKIKNMVADRSCHDLSLFGVTDGAKIVNLILENCEFSAEARMGALIGTAFRTQVDQCAVINVKVNGIYGPKVKIGGIVGWSQGSEITNCYSSGVVYSQGDEAGGICGAAESGSTIANCYTTCIVESDNHAGGIAGAGNGSALLNCVVASTEINCATDVFRVCGIDHGVVTRSNCYAFENLLVNGNPATDDLGATTKNGANASQEELTSVDFYDGIGFAIKATDPDDDEYVQIWKIDATVSPYPVFLWQEGEETAIRSNDVSSYTCWTDGDGIKMKGFAGGEQIKVYSSTGQITALFTASAFMESFNIRQSGVYFIRIVSGGNSRTLKVIR
ncbi:MAG: T9SS type A sorting domain-containing protein [Candidatus Symbiothrix sp.]|jgi:hypothetical protein|nr:T9SS type A sorting domain-containing protein [Candidatus Symbiothrix sp.]